MTLDLLVFAQAGGQEAVDQAVAQGRELAVGQTVHHEHRHGAPPPAIAASPCSTAPRKNSCTTATRSASVPSSAERKSGSASSIDKPRARSRQYNATRSKSR